MKDLNETRLVQRLEKPWKSGDILGDIKASFAFGGGLKNGGLSDQAFTMLKDIFSFDYMGAAEFEFGAVPQALKMIASNADHLEAFTIQFPLSEVKEPYSFGYHRVNGRRVKKKKVTQECKSLAEIFVIAPKEWREELAVRIKKWACEDYNPGLKASTCLNASLRPTEDYHKRKVGWLELDNGFFFFTDREMFKQVAELFGVTTGSEGSVTKVAA